MKHNTTYVNCNTGFISCVRYILNDTRNGFRGMVFIALVVGLTINAFAQTPDWEWAKSGGGSNSDISYSIAAYVNGNCFVTGYFYSPTITFGSITLTNNGGADMFVVKYDNNGNVVWAKNAGGSNSDISYSIAVDVNGNCYVTGIFSSSTIIFGSVTLAKNNCGYSDMYVVKYDNNGNVVWAKNVACGYSFSIVADATGNCYVTGSFGIPTITFGSITLTNNGGTDMFVVKYDINGNVVWAKGGEGDSDFDIVGNSITVDLNGNCYVTGEFNSPVITFGNITLTNTSGDDNDMFVVKYDNIGNVMWAKSAVGSYYDIGNSIATDMSGNFFVTGYFESPTITFGNITLTRTSGSSDMYAVKYDNSGNVVWARNTGGDNGAEGSSIATDVSGNCYVTGNFGCSTITFGDIILTNNGSNASHDMFAVKYDNSGNVLWAKSAGGTGSDNGYSIAVDGNENSYVTGFFSSSSILFGTTTLASGGGMDIFVAKINSITDTTKYRTFTVTSAMGAKSLSLKPKKNKPALLPTVANWRDTSVARSGGKAGMTLGIPQTDKNLAKTLGWIRFKKGSDMVKFYSVLQTDSAYNAPFDTVRKSGSNKKKRFVKELVANANSYTNPLAQEFAVFKLNMLSSQQKVTPESLYALTYVKDGNLWSGMTLYEMMKNIDTVLTYYTTKKFPDGDSAYVGSPKLESLRKTLQEINGAFDTTIALANGDSVVANQGLKFPGIIGINTVSFLKRLPTSKVFVFENGEEREKSLPNEFTLLQNYPNPFNPQTAIGFSLLAVGNVTLKIYNVLGQEVATLLNNEQMEEGMHEVQFDASRLSSGVYYYRLQAGAFTEVKKMVLMK